MSDILLVGCDPADAAILESNLRQARHQTFVFDPAEAAIGDVLARPWDAVVTPSRGPSGSFAENMAARLQTQDWRPLASVLVFESPAQESGAGLEALTSGADVFVDRAHIEALVPALESGLRRARRLAEQVEQLRQGALHVQRLRGEGGGQPAAEPSSQESALGCLLVDGEGDVVASDLRSNQLLGREPRGWNLADLAPDGALATPFRAAQHIHCVGEAFDVSQRGNSAPLTLRPTCMPVGREGDGLTVVLLQQVNPQLETKSDGSLPASWMQSVNRVRRSLGASRIHAHSAAGAELRSRVREFAEYRSPLAILGDPGVGRSHVARCVHYENPMAGAFHEVRSLTLTDLGVERELFGASGAIARLGSADTLLVTHVETLPEGTQRRLAACLQPGGDDCLAARLVLTSAPGFEGLVPELVAHVAANVLPVPNLRQRGEDLPQLALEALAAVGARSPLPEIDSGALRLLQAASLTRNFDDLEQCMRLALAASDGHEIKAEDLPAEVSAAPQQEGGEWCQAPWSITDADPVCFEVYERKAIQRALASCRGDKVAAAQLLEVGRSTLYRKLRNLGLE